MHPVQHTFPQEIKQLLPHIYIKCFPAWRHSEENRSLITNHLDNLKSRSIRRPLRLILSLFSRN